MLLRAQCLLLLSAWVACALAGTAANRWIEEAREGITRTDTAIETFDPQAGDPEAVESRLRRLVDLRLGATHCIDARDGKVVVPIPRKPAEQ